MNELHRPKPMRNLKDNFFETLDSPDFEEAMRFEKPHFIELLTALEIPDPLQIHSRGKTLVFPAKVALGLTLWRLSGPADPVRDKLIWGISQQVMRRIFNAMIEFLYEKWGHLLTKLQVDPILKRAESFCKAMHAKSPLDRCWAFLTTNCPEIPEPKPRQHLFYTGWEEDHALRYQSIDTPDGIIRQLWGPLLSDRYDVSVLEEAALQECLLGRIRDRQGVSYCTYRHFPSVPKLWMATPYSRVRKVQERKFNEEMGEAYDTDEWGFARVVEMWPYVNYAEEQQPGMTITDLKKQYVVAGLLTNCHNCMYISESSLHFDVPAPRLKEYLRAEG